MSLTTQDQADAARALAGKMFQELSVTANMNHDDLQAAVAAADAWADSHAADYNAALPVPFRTTATAAQKAFLLAFLCMKRAGVI